MLNFSLDGTLTFPHFVVKTYPWKKFSRKLTAQKVLVKAATATLTSICLSCQQALVFGFRLTVCFPDTADYYTIAWKKNIETPVCCQVDLICLQPCLVHMLFFPSLFFYLAVDSLTRVLLYLVTLMD